MKNDYLDPKYIAPFAFQIPQFYVSILLQAFEDAADPSEGLRISFDAVVSILKDLVGYAIKNNQVISGGIYGVLTEILDLMDRRE
jgi:MoaA/NifB/PqqE/SkfB family radical SAM enzyme